MTLNLVKGEFSSLEEALRAQVQKMEAELTELKTHNKLMLGMVADRDNAIAQQSIVINDLRSQLETPINFDDDE